MNEMPVRKDWATMRDKAGGKAGLCQGVSIGTLLDDYFKGTSSKKRIKPSEKLEAGLVKYQKAAEKAALPKLVKLVKEFIVFVQKDRKHLKMDSDSGVYMSECIKQGLINCNKLVTKPTVAAYHTFYGQTIRAMGQAFKRVGDDVADLVGPWNALVEDYEDDLPMDEDGQNFKVIGEAVDRHLRQLHVTLTERGII